MNKKFKSIRILPVLLGFIVGCLLALLVSQNIMLRIRSKQLGAQFHPIATESVSMTSEEEIYNTLAKSDQYVQGGQYQKAIDLIKPVVESWPSEIDRSSGYNIMAIAEAQSGNFNKAIDYAEKVTELTPGSWSYQLLAQIYEADGDLVRALGAYKKVLEYDDNDSRSNPAFAEQKIYIIQYTLGTQTP